MVVYPAIFILTLLFLINIVSGNIGYKKVCTSDGICGQCLTDNDCKPAAPFCDTNTLTCHECVTDLQCRSNNNCDRKCVNFRCDTDNVPLVCDTSTEVCYERYGLCLSQCKSDSFCATIPYVLHYPNTGVCDVNNTKKCYDCLTSSDCNPQSNISCGAECVWSPNGFEYLCTNSDTCVNGKTCKLKNSAYLCSSAGWILVSYPLILLLFIQIFV
jgi:hypothetical protein